MSARELRVVAGVIEDTAGRVLAALRPPGGEIGGLWEFPGGKVEAGESDEQALARELEEELGVQVRVGRQVASVRHPYSRGTLLLVAYTCTVEEGTPAAHEHDALRWLAADELRAVHWAAADLAVVDALLA